MVNKDTLDPEVKQYILDLEYDNKVLQESLTAMRQEFEELTRNLHTLKATAELLKEAQDGYN